MMKKQMGKDEFLSTLPARGATQRSSVPGLLPDLISIHAPREGSDDERLPG